MPGRTRSVFQQEVVDALLESQAINLEAIGATLSKFGARAVREGEPLVHIINRHVMWACGWPGPEIDILGLPQREAE